MTATLTPPIKWHGGKHYLADRIVGLMPPRCRKPNAPEPGDPGWLHYVEPYAGGLAVLLANDPEGISEVVNDLNGGLIRFWEVLASESYFPQFQRMMEATPFGSPVWETAAHEVRDTLLGAGYFFVRCRQSLSGRMDSFAGISRTRTRRGMNEQVAAWLTAVEGLPAVHARLKRVLILNRDALDVIRSEDGPRTLFYLDPPYLHETRATTGEYAHEMTAAQHNELLNLLDRIKGRFLLSGYRSKAYDDAAEACGWHRTDFDLPNNAAGGKAKRRMVESVWTNFEPGV